MLKIKPLVSYSKEKQFQVHKFDNKLVEALLGMKPVLYTIYKTTCLVSQKFYFGVHKTENPHDAYLGSGKYLLRAVAKHGPANFLKQVLFVFDESNRESAFAKEDELIQCYRGDPLCMNLRKGGSGGFDYINQNGMGRNFSPVFLATGRRHSESGFIQRLGRIYGRKAVTSGRLAKLRTPEHQAAAGKVSGRANVLSGHLDRIRTPQSLAKAHRNAGLAAKKSGQLARISLKGTHVYWHERRGIISSDCKFCQGEAA